MTRGPCVSVVIPVFDAGKLLGEALRSVRRQGELIGELIVVNDGSTDDVEREIAPFRADVRYVAQLNSGPAAARNRGIALARHEYLAFLDADDLWRDGAISRAVQLLDTRRDAAGVHGLTQLITHSPGEGSEVPSPVGHAWRSPQLGSLLVRRSLFQRLGQLETSLRHGEDLDWIIRARETDLLLAPLEEVMLLYRIHARNMTRGASARERNTLLVLKRSLDRRRQRTNGGDAC